MSDFGEPLETTRRDFLGAVTAMVVSGSASSPAVRSNTLRDDAGAAQTQGRVVTIAAKPKPISFDISKTAVIVCDMQNDFGSAGGMFHRAGIDISVIQRAVPPTAKVLAAARRVGIRCIYLKMAFRPDLSDAGSLDSPNRIKHLPFSIGDRVRAPDGTASRVLVRDTWNTEIVSELTPHPEDIVLNKIRYSGFYQTELDVILKGLGITHLLVTGCTTSVCVESTVRDAMFRDYSPIVLADCTAEPIGHDLPRSNHEASLLTIETLLGWVSDSAALVQALN